jgi:hypothetical protein
VITPVAPVTPPTRPTPTPATQEPSPEPAALAEPDFRALVLRHLERQLESAGLILAQVRDPAWLGRQSAADLAALYGVVFDRAARILAALPAETEDDHTAGER